MSPIEDDLAALSSYKSTRFVDEDGVLIAIGDSRLVWSHALVAFPGDPNFYEVLDTDFSASSPTRRVRSCGDSSY